MAAIMLTDARGKQTRFELPSATGESFIIGTAIDCTVSLPRAIGMAAHHARIEYTAEGYILTSITPGRGFMVDGEMHEQQSLQPNTTYKIGNVSIDFLPQAEGTEVREEYSDLLKPAAPSKWKTIVLDTGIVAAAFGVGLLLRHFIAGILE